MNSPAKWLNWLPKQPASQDIPVESPKPAREAVSVACPAVSAVVDQNSLSDQDTEQVPDAVPYEVGTSSAEPLTRAGKILADNGVRLMTIDGQRVVGIWSNRDSATLRGALRVIGSDRMPVRYLDGAGVPNRYKTTNLDLGNPVTLDVLAEMEKHPEAPWEIRDRILRGQHTYNSLDEWRQASVARQFEEARARDRHLSLSEKEELAWEAKRREKEEAKNWLDRQHQIAHGYAKWAYWFECDPRGAEAYRRSREDTKGEWLIEVALDRKIRRRPKAPTQIKPVGDTEAEAELKGRKGMGASDMTKSATAALRQSPKRCSSG